MISILKFQVCRLTPEQQPIVTVFQFSVGLKHLKRIDFDPQSLLLLISKYRFTAQCLVRELHACETASIAIELSGALKEAMSVESVGGLLQRQRVETALQMDLQDSLYRLLEIGNFDLRVEAGACLTLLLTLCPPESMLLCSRQVDEFRAKFVDEIFRNEGEILAFISNTAVHISLLISVFLLSGTEQFG